MALPFALLAPFVQRLVAEMRFGPPTTGRPARIRVVRPHKTLRLVRDGSGNVRFQDAIRLAEAFGFRVVRISGSHHLLARAGVPELLNFQERNGLAKPYQLRQLLWAVEQYNLKLEDEP